MPKLSDDTLFTRALRLAIMDRLSLADCYTPDSPHAIAARAEATKLQALKGRKLASLSEEEQDLGFKAFLHAEQWEFGLADSSHGKGKQAEESLRNHRLFKEVRHRRWGKTHFEAMEETAISVDIRQIAANAPERKM